MKRDAAAISQQIDGIWIQFRAQLGDAFKTAYEVEEGAGSSAAWQALCAQWNVALISEEERRQVRAAQKPLRGAPAMELLAVTKNIVSLHRIALKKIDAWDVGQGVESKYDRLMALLERTDNELLTAYRNAVLPKQGGMFGNVFVGAQPGAKPASTAPAVVTLTCRGCGAPRLSAKDFTCAYCDQQLV
ncbi:MAG: hypothetical protein ABI333_11315 [bacterium]